MKISTSRSLAAAMAVVLVVALPACSRQAPPATQPTTGEERAPEPEPTPPPRPEPAEPAEAGEWEAAAPAGTTLTPEELNRMGVLRAIYFDYDRSEIRPDQRPVLQANAQWLRENPGARILIEGHCDERGTREYNMALGERRASAATQYLVSLGIPVSRIETVSYGEERPAVEGSDESAWSRNRRAEFVIIATGEEGR